MDQLKPILAQCKKHLFWIVTGIAVVTGTVGFFLASSTLGDLFDTQKSALDTHHQNVQTVRSAVPTHPNQASQDQMQQIIDRVAKDVEQAWRLQYERQERFLVWPDSIRKLSPALVNRLDKLRPIELKTNYPEEPPGITPGYKRTFARYFDEDMPRLANIIGVEWVGEVAATTGAGGMMGAGMMGGGYGGSGYGDGGYGGSDGGYGDYGGEDGGFGGMYGAGGGGYGGGMLGNTNSKRDLVTWPKTSQDELLASMRLWKGNEPSVFQILYTQENMWILEGLLNIIKKTNGNARANFQCVIKEIEFLRIGRTAVGQAGTISGAGRGAAGGMMGGGGNFGAGGGEYGDEDYGAGYGGESYGGGMYGEGDGTNPGYGEGGGGGMPATPADPANNRYVDANFQPVSGDDLRSKMQSSSPDDAYFAVAKRVPVRMRFTIDQRRTHEFLANCGNADLMLEIRQVRLGDTEPAGASSAGGYGGGYGGMAGMMGGMMGGPGGTMDGGEGYGGEGYGGGYGGGAAMNASPSTFDIDIEVYGIVYLFNPVDIDRLGLSEVTEDTKLDDTVDVQVAEPTPPASDQGQPATGSGDGQPGGQPGQPGGQPGQPGGQPGQPGGQPGQPGGQPGQPGGQPGQPGGQPGQPGGQPGQPGGQPGQPGGQPGQPGGQPGQPGGQPGQP